MNTKLSHICGAVAAATCLWGAGAVADEVITERVAPSAPVVEEHHRTTTTTTTTSPTVIEPRKLSHDEKERLEKEKDLREDLRDADKEYREKVRDAVKDANDD